MTTKRRKVQVSIPIDEYDAIEKRWKSYGFSSVAEAARVMLMGDLNEHVKEMRRQVSAMEKMDELQAKKEKSKQHVKTKPERTKTATEEKERTKTAKKPKQEPTGKNYPRSNPKVEKTLVRWLNDDIINKDVYDKAKGVREWRDDEGKLHRRVWIHGG